MAEFCPFAKETRGQTESTGKYRHRDSPMFDADVVVFDIRRKRLTEVGR